MLLQGIRILDLSAYTAGPFGTMLLADLGAEVIKIERPGEGDSMRVVRSVNVAGEGSTFLGLNRGKKSLVLDLNQEGGKEVFYDLVRKSDVVYDNFRPGVVEKLKIDFATLQQFNPRIVCCSISGYGKSGPWSERASYDLVLQAESGLMSINGEPGGPPLKLGLSMGDLSGGLYAAIAVAAAVRWAEKTNEGVQIDLALLDCTISLLAYFAQYYLSNGIVTQPVGSGHPTSAPWQAYRAKDHYMVVAASPQQHWLNLCRAIGREDLSNHPLFATTDLRVKNKEKLNSILEEIFAQKELNEWLELFSKGDVPAAPVNPIDKAMNLPQLQARGMVVELEHQKCGPLRMVGNPFKVFTPSGQAEPNLIPPPMLGQHGLEVVESLLGYSKEKIVQLQEQGIIVQGAE